MYLRNKKKKILVSKIVKINLILIVKNYSNRHYRIKKDKK